MQKKQTKENGLKREPVHQEAFERMKQVISRAVTLAYPDFRKSFEVHTDSSDERFGGVVQNGRPISLL